MINVSSTKIHIAEERMTTHGTHGVNNNKNQSESQSKWSLQKKKLFTLTAFQFENRSFIQNMAGWLLLFNVLNQRIALYAVNKE